MFKQSVVALIGATLFVCAGCEMMNGEQASDRQPSQRQSGEERNGLASMFRRDEGVDQYTRGWPTVSQKAAREMQEKYGNPDGRTSRMLTWHNKGPWKAIIVYRDPVQHNFPMRHEDVLEQVIAMDVPVDKFDDLAQFDGSIIVERTKGTLAARCDKEAANFLALNLANDIINNRKTVQEARQAYADAIQQFMSGQTVAMMQALQFEPMQRGGDTDVAVIQGQPNEARPAAAQQAPRQQQQRQSQ